MKRRAFIAFAGLGAVALVSIRALQGKHDSFLSYGELPQNIKALYEPTFDNALADYDLKQLVAKLQQLGVVIDGKIIIEKVNENRMSDVLLTFDNTRYTESELTLYAFIARLRSQSLLRFFI